MTGVFLQVRLGSSRLPRKALAQIGEAPVVALAMRSLRRLPASVHAILTDPDSEDELRPIAESEGFSTVVGSPDNVLERYVRAADAFGVDEIVRATGDNPLVSPLLASLAVRARRALEADYFGFDGLPLGTGVEAVRSSALKQALAETDSDYDREHVCPYLYNHPDAFRCVREDAPPAFRLRDARVTIDTAKDLERVRGLFARCGDGGPVPLRRLIRCLEAGE